MRVRVRAAGPQLRGRHGAAGPLSRRAQAAVRGRATRPRASSTRSAPAYRAAGGRPRAGADALRRAHRHARACPPARCCRMPDAMTFEEAAALPVDLPHRVPHALPRRPAAPGERVLVHMAAGGVGLAALQLCRTVPGRDHLRHRVGVEARRSSASRAARTPSTTDPGLRRRGPRASPTASGVDLVLDALGGPDWKKGYDLLAPAGRLIAFGFANMASGRDAQPLPRGAASSSSVPKFTPAGLMDDNRGVAGVNIGHLWDEMELLQPRDRRALLELYREGKIKPHDRRDVPVRARRRGAPRWRSGRTSARSCSCP